MKSVGLLGGEKCTPPEKLTWIPKNHAVFEAGDTLKKTFLIFMLDFGGGGGGGVDFNYFGFTLCFDPCTCSTMKLGGGWQFKIYDHI